MGRAVRDLNVITDSKVDLVGESMVGNLPRTSAIPFTVRAVFPGSE